MRREMPNPVLEPTRMTRYDLPMSRRLFDIAWAAWLSLIVMRHHIMRIIFGILSFCAAGWLAFGLVPVVDQVVLGYLFRDQSTGFSLMQLGPIHLYEGHICILAAAVVLFIIVLILAGIYAFTSRDTTT